MEMRYVKVWLDWKTATKELKDAEKGRLMDAIASYARGEDHDQYLTGNERFVFPMFQLQIDRDRAELTATEEARRRAGIASGESRRTKRTHVDSVEQNGTNANKTNEDYRLKAKDNSLKAKDDRQETNTGDIGASPQKRTRAFVPPTPSDVREYCLEHGYAVDAERFCDYYQKQGWRLSNGLPCVDWEACVRQWVRRDKERGARPQPQSSGNVFAELAKEGVFEDDDAPVAF